MSDEDIYVVAKEINERLKWAYHYINEWEFIMEQANQDEGFIFKKYYFSLGFIKKSYLETSILVLNTLFERNGAINFYTLRNAIEEKLHRTIDPFSYKNLDKVINGLKTIRDKSIAHVDSVNVNQFWKDAGVSKNDIDNLIKKSHKYLLNLLDLAGVKNDFLLSDFSEWGLKLIYEKLEEHPEEDLDNFLEILSCSSSYIGK